MDERLYRSTDDRMLAGVAGGLAEMWDADPSLIRIVWALLAFFTGGIALVVYIVMAIVVPERPDDWVPMPQTPGTAGAWTPPATSPAATRADARAARRAARATRRASRRRNGPSGVGVIVGGFLIVIGAVALVRIWFPDFGFDWFWPVMLIALGVLLLIGAIDRGRDAAVPSPTPGAPDGSDPPGAGGGPAS